MSKDSFGFRSQIKKVLSESDLTVGGLDEKEEIVEGLRHINESEEALDLSEDVNFQLLRLLQANAEIISEGVSLLKDDVENDEFKEGLEFFEKVVSDFARIVDSVDINET